MKKATPDLDLCYLLRETFLILAGSYLLFLASSHNGLVQPATLLITAIFLSISVAAWLFSRNWGPTPLGVPILVFIFVLSFTSFFSIDPRRSFAEVWLIGIAIFIYASNAELVRRGWPRELILKVLLILGVIFMGLAWAEVIRWHILWHGAAGMWFPPTSYRLPLPNFYGVILNVMVMIALALLISTRSMAGRIGLGLWCLSALGLIFFTSSRGGWLGTAAGLLVIGIWIFGQQRQKIFAQIRFLLNHKFLMFIAGIIFLILLSGIGSLVYRQAVHPTHASIYNARGSLWGPAWQAFLRSPWVGEGLYTFISQYVQYQSIPPGTVFVYAHNIYLDLLSGSGILGLAAYIWLFVSLLVILKKKTSESSHSEMAIGALASVIAFSVHGFFDSVHHTIPTSLWILSILLGAVMGEDSNRPGRIVMPTGLIVGLLVVLFSWVNLWMILPLNKGVQEASSGDLAAARSSLDVAIQRDPRLAIAYQQQGMVLSQLADMKSQTALEDAIRMFEKTIALDIHWPLNHANLGALLREAGRLSEAEEELTIACNAAPDAAIFQLNLGEVQELLGETSQASATYHRTLELAPAWAGAYFWRETEFRKRFISQWNKDNPPLLLTINDLEINLESNKARAAPYLPLAAFYLQEDQVEDADRLLVKAGLLYFSSSADKLEYDWLKAGSAALKGDVRSAVVEGQAAIDGYLHQGMYGPGSEGRSYYSQLMFRRPQIRMELVPQFTLIKLNDPWGERMAELCEWYQKLGESGKSSACSKILIANIPDFFERPE
jgi:O-antigen ligase/tetratricopeptide (TPR) repeat protein